MQKKRSIENHWKAKFIASNVRHKRLKNIVSLVIFSRGLSSMVHWSAVYGLSRDRKRWRRDKADSFWNFRPTQPEPLPRIKAKQSCSYAFSTYKLLTQISFWELMNEKFFFPIQEKFLPSNGTFTAKNKFDEFFMREREYFRMISWLKWLVVASTFTFWYQKRGERLK